jgi:ribose transport system ATP-binding protein
MGEVADVAPRERGAAAAPVLGVEGLRKAFGGTQALDDVSFALERGRIHALLGGNGSGKSTTIKVLAGVYQADEGRVTLGGQTHDVHSLSPALAKDAGLRFVHQQDSLFPTLTVAENLAFGHGFETGAGWRVRWRSQHRRAEGLLARLELDVAPTAIVGTLGLATQTMVTIARALQDIDDATDAVLVLDEPTSSLPPHEADLLLEALLRYATAGQTIMYVSHRLDEIVHIADRATILRDGKVATTIDREEISHDRLVELIMGRKAARMAHRAPPQTTRRDAPALEVRGLAGGAVRSVDLEVRPGEIVGVAGLLGSGRTTLLRLLFGAQAPAAGEIVVNGVDRRFSSPSEAMKAGVAYVPEDRLRDAAFAQLNVTENIGMAVAGRYFRGGRLRHRRERKDATDLMAKYMVKAESPRARFSTMSGGNQQKVILARWLRREPAVLLLDEPTQGVDVGARLEIWDLIREGAARGAAVIAVCSDFDELARACDRAVILQRGVLVGGVQAADLDGSTLEHSVLWKEAV